MLFKASLYTGIREDDITVAFRWKRPSVKAGGTLVTPVGQLAIDAVEVISSASITDEDARRAGAADADEVRRSLRPGEDRQLYRIRFHRLGDDPRLTLRDEKPDTDTPTALTAQLRQLDQRSTDGPWTAGVLDIIARRPATLAAELASELGLERDAFMRRVRRLKALGLTESLAVGYRLAPRGQHLLRHIQKRD